MNRDVNDLLKQLQNNIKPNDNKSTLRIYLVSRTAVKLCNTLQQRNEIHDSITIINSLSYQGMNAISTNIRICSSRKRSITYIAFTCLTNIYEMQ